MNPKSNRLDLESSMRTTGMSGAAGECRVVNIKSALDADARSARRALRPRRRRNGSDDTESTI